VALSTAALLVSLPVIGVIAVLVKLTSKGRVFFAQERVGENGRVFRMYKFRTMVEGAEEKLKDLVDLDKLTEPVFKLDQDPRITPLGRWLRRTSIDEIPQFFNVLRGDMSLVGPRPEEKAVVERYSIWQRRRLKVKPGITGLQQVECRGSKSLSERVLHDIAYIRRQSFLLDMSILLRTIFVVLIGRGAR
jgi:lipopolysaccharide/colanic/teichoic acid biosynthesis glycosyltransferase